VLMGLFEELANGHPELKRKLLMAKMKPSPAAYLRTTVLSSLWISVTLVAATFLFLQGMSTPALHLLFIVVVVFAVSFYALYALLLRIVDIKIRRMAKDIDREVLFAGRFLLVKLNAGRPLITAISEASRSYGVANACFKELVREIDIGTPLEEALSKASRYSPSEKFRHILFQISNALKIGIDVSKTLEAVLDDIAEEQLVEIQRYGRKLNSLTMFFMLFSIVLPSLGITLFVTVVSMFSANFDLSFFLLLAFAILLLELFFLTIFKSIRPNVNI
jgi:pilus assembly protein TadC